jgi:hypothetical protein
MKKLNKLYVDQYGRPYFACIVKELRGKVGNGGSRVNIMYCEGTDGKVYRTGYVIGSSWLTEYTPTRTPV